MDIAWQTGICEVWVIDGVTAWLARPIGQPGEELAIAAYLRGVLQTINTQVERLEVGPGQIGVDAEVLVVYRSETRRQSHRIVPERCGLHQLHSNPV